MTLTYADEDGLEGLLDQPSLSLLNLWDQLCKIHLGIAIPIAVASRYDSDIKAISEPTGQMNSSSFGLLDGRLHLIIWMEHFGRTDVAFECLIFFHELAHRVLSLQGFGDIVPRDESEYRIFTGLLSVAQHVPLYSLQRSMGQSVQTMVDQRAFDDLKYFRAKGFSAARSEHLFECFLLADDLLNASDGVRVMIRNGLLNTHTETAKYVQIAVDLAAQCQLGDPSQNLEFQKELAAAIGVEEPIAVRNGKARIESEIEAARNANVLPTILYRVDKRQFVEGQTISTAGEYYKSFDATRKIVEDELERHRPPEKPLRVTHLFLFESLDAAKKHWSKMKEGKLYRVTVSHEQCLHRGNMLIMDMIKDCIASGGNPTVLCKQYWGGVLDQHAEIEILVKSATVSEILFNDERERIAFLKERYK